MKQKSAAFLINAEKLWVTRDILKYLSIEIVRQGIMHLPDRVQAIKDIAVPTNKKQLRRLKGVINYYRDMWKYRSGILILFTTMTSKQAT